MISMDIRTASASVPFGCRRLALMAAAASLVLTAAWTVATPAPQSPATEPPEPQLTYSPWTKVCRRERDSPQGKEFCTTRREAELSIGQLSARAALIDEDGHEKMSLHIQVPLSPHRPAATRFVARVSVSSLPRIQERGMTCRRDRCTVYFELDEDFLKVLRRRQFVQLEIIDPPAITPYVLPLGGLANANVGPPLDPIADAEQQRQLQAELARRAEEARRKLQRQDGSPGGEGK
jgi:invasion protein IalB